MNPEFMREAIRISLEMMRGGHGGPFGAVVVKNDRIIGRGWNQVTASNDPTAHAEIVAIRDACRFVRNFHLDGCEIYTSCEPCPMCLSAIYWSHIGHVYFGNTRQDAAEIGFDDEFIYEQVGLPIEDRKVVFTSVLQDEAFVAFDEWRRKPDKVRY